MAPPTGPDRDAGQGYELSPRVADSILQLVADLVSGNYDAIDRDGRVGRLTRDALARVVSEYGRTLTPVPRAALRDAAVYAVSAEPGKFKIDVDLWTREEGRSDLTLSLTVEERPAGVVVTIDDLHVL